MAIERSTLVSSLADLFHKTSEDHHIAFRETDGVDPDWAIWYAGHLIENGIEKMLDAKLLKSDLIYLLVSADKEINALAPGAHWEFWYADRFVRRYLPQLI
jgi:hypothetical protein